jgi:hypothetical protein
MRCAPLAAPSLLAIVVASVIESATAAAQPTDAGSPRRPPLIESLSGPAKEAYEAALILVNNKDCAHAIAKFRQAYALESDPRLLFDIAVCDRDLHAYAEMQAMLLRYAKEASSQLSAEEKADVEAALAAIRSLVGAVLVTVSEAGAEIRVDGEPAATSPMATPIVLDLGRHTLSVTKDGFEPVERAVEIGGGSETSVVIALLRLSRPGQLHITADPGATIVVDEKHLAHGSFDGAMPPGVHKIQITEAGKKPYEARIPLGDGETRMLQVKLENERQPVLWPWFAGGAAALVGAGVGAYFVLRPQDTRGTGPQGQLFTFTIPPGAH